jgi:hypothetical protein
MGKNDEITKNMPREFITDVLSGHRITIIPGPVSSQNLVPPKNAGPGVGAGSKPAHPRCDNRKDYLEPYGELSLAAHYEHVIRSEEIEIFFANISLIILRIGHWMKIIWRAV